MKESKVDYDLWIERALLDRDEPMPVRSIAEFINANNDAQVSVSNVYLFLTTNSGAKEKYAISSVEKKARSPQVNMWWFRKELEKPLDPVKRKNNPFSPGWTPRSESTKAAEIQQPPPQKVPLLALIRSRVNSNVSDADFRAFIRTLVS